MSRLFGRKVRYLRLTNDLTQTELAAKLGLARPAHLSNLEAGRREPSLQLVLHLALLLQVSTDYLIRDTLPLEAAHYYRAHQIQLPVEYRHLGAKLSYVRSQAGLTQTALSKQLALTTPTHLSAIEHGRKTPSIALLVHIADIFGVTTDYFLRDDLPVETDPTSASL